MKNGAREERDVVENMHFTGTLAITKKGVALWGNPLIWNLVGHEGIEPSTY